jgi:cell division control protein 6
MVAAIPLPPPRHGVGDRVLAVYADGQAYAATIAGVREGGSYTVDWDDGDDRHRERAESEVFPLNGEGRVEEQPADGAAEGSAAAPTRRRGRKATQAGIAAPPLAETAAESLNRKRKLEQAQLAREQAPRKKPAPPPSLHIDAMAATGLNPTDQVRAARPGEEVGVVGREKQMEQMLSFCKKCVNAGKGGSMYISGAPGVGKTLTMHTMQRLLKRWQFTVGKTSRIVMINAMQLNDPEHIFTMAYKSIYPKAGEPARAQVRSTLERRLKQSWEEETHTTFLFIDEIDGLLSASNRSVLYKLFEWPHLAGSRLAVIGIANSIDLIESTLPYLQQKNIVPEPLHFRTYAQEELKRILQWRMAKVGEAKEAADCEGTAEGGEAAATVHGENMWKVGLSRVELDSQAIELCARKVAAVSGDVRKLLALANRAATIAVREAKEEEAKTSAAAGTIPLPDQKTLVDITHVMEASTDLFGGQTVKILRQLTQIQQLAVLAFVSLLRSERAGDRVTLSDLYASFSSLIRQWNLSAYHCDKSEFLSLCENALEAQRVVSLSKGVGGARGLGKAKGKTRNPLAARPKKRSSGGGGGGDARLVTLSMKEADIIKALSTHKAVYVRENTQPRARARARAVT